MNNEGVNDQMGRELMGMAMENYEASLLSDEIWVC